MPTPSKETPYSAKEKKGNITIRGNIGNAIRRKKRKSLNSHPMLTDFLARPRDNNTVEIIAKKW